MIRRGDIVIGAQNGPMTGKPRPLLVIQNDIASELHGAICGCLITTDLTGRALIRVSIIPSSSNGLSEVSEIQVDQIHTFRRSGLRETIGTLSVDDMHRVDDALRRWLSL